MSKFTEYLPKEVGLYSHRYTDSRGNMYEQTLFVGYVNPNFPKNQGSIPMLGMTEMRCCPPLENLNANRLTPGEWRGWWRKLEEIEA